MRRRETATLVALIDAVVAPEPPLPPVRETDAVAAFAAWLAAAPRLNRLGVRAALAALELAPLVARRAPCAGRTAVSRARFSASDQPGRHAVPRSRFSRLDRPGRLAVLGALGGHAATRGAAEGLRSAASVTYYGDEGVLRALGHDPAARVREARERRRREVPA